MTWHNTDIRNLYFIWASNDQCIVVFGADFAGEGHNFLGKLYRLVLFGKAHAVLEMLL